MESLCLALSSYRRICLVLVMRMRCVTGGVDEGVPDPGAPAAGRRRAFDLERGRRRPEDEPLGERVPAQAARVRPSGTHAKPAAAERHERQGQQRPVATRRRSSAQASPPSTHWQSGTVTLSSVEVR